MATKTENLPAVQTNENALQLIQKHKSNKDLVFVAEEDLHTQVMFIPVVVAIHATPDDFHNISGNLMPKGYQVDRIGEASGISFVAENCGVRKESEDVYVGYAQGKKRLPDGTWRPSSVCEYEFDVKTRSEEDFLNDSKKREPKYKAEIDRKAHILQLKKFARQRAGTGARLKVIRELTGMPISFKPNEIQKAMVFSRVAVNTDMLFADPEMREAAIQLATGTARDIYGPQKHSPNYQINGKEQEQLEAPEEEDPPFNTEPSASPEEEEIEANLKELEGLSKVSYLHKDAKSLAEDMLNQEKPNLDAVIALIEQIREWLNKPQVVEKYGPYQEATS